LFFLLELGIESDSQKTIPVTTSSIQTCSSQQQLLIFKNKTFLISVFDSKDSERIREELGKHGAIFENDDIPLDTQKAPSCIDFILVPHGPQGYSISLYQTKNHGPDVVTTQWIERCVKVFYFEFLFCIVNFEEKHFVHS
jgi:hypothetical protein